VNLQIALHASVDANAQVFRDRCAASRAILRGAPRVDDVAAATGSCSIMKPTPRSAFGACKLARCATISGGGLGKTEACRASL